MGIYNKNGEFAYYIFVRRGFFISKTNVIMAASAVFSAIMLAAHPSELTGAAASALILWYKSVLPALFPFITASLVLLNTGVPELVSKLFAPFMKPLFGLSGICGFAWLCGLIAGYPTGAKITYEMLSDEKITTSEAERLMTFCNCPGPLFIIGTVGASFFGDKTFGYLLFTSVFLASTLTGIAFRFKSLSPTVKIIPQVRKRAYTPAGAILGSAVSSAAETTLLVCGYIVVFAVILKALEITGAVAYASRSINIPEDTLYAVLSGFLEMTQGTFCTSLLGVPLEFRLALAASLLSWGGLSINMQVLAVISGSKINMRPYFLSRPVAAFFAAMFCLIIYKAVF